MESTANSDPLLGSDESPMDIELLFKDAYKGKIKEKYHFETKLSSGGFGIVYLAVERKTKQKFAIKAIQKKSLKDLQTFVNEVKILQTLDHPNIIKLYEIWEWNEVCFLVLEYCEGGELF
jgi:serine/threonine protein kinase